MMNSTLPAGLVDQVAGLTPSQREELQIVIDELDHPLGSWTVEELQQLLASRIADIDAGTANLQTAEESVQRIRKALYAEGFEL